MGVCVRVYACVCERELDATGAHLSLACIWAHTRRCSRERVSLLFSVTVFSMSIQMRTQLPSSSALTVCSAFTPPSPPHHLPDGGGEPGHVMTARSYKTSPGSVCRCCVLCLLLQYLIQSCARGGRRIVEDMCYEIRRAEACVD
jgi:hypothetical protein